MILITVINQNLESLIPIIFEFKKDVKEHIIFCDDSNEDKRLASNLKKAILKQSRKKVKIIQIDEDSKSDMSHIQDELAKIKETLYLNATGSDLSLVVSISQYILNHNGYVLAYDKFENSYNKISKESFTNQKLKNNLKLDDFFVYMGYEKVFEEDVNFAKKYHHQLTSLFSENKRFFQNEFLLRSKKIDSLDEKFRRNLEALDKNYKSNISFGKLFEYFVYLKLKEYDFDDIKMGVKLMFDTNLEIQNEFDVLAIKDNHIITIECKLGTTSEANEVIYKLDSLIENFGEDSKGMIVNIHSDTNTRKNFVAKHYSKYAYKRAKYNNLEIYNDYYFDESRFCEIVEDFFDVEK